MNYNRYTIIKKDNELTMQEVIDNDYYARDSQSDEESSDQGEEFDEFKKYKNLMMDNI